MPYIHIIVLYEIFVILVTLYFIIKLHFKNNRISKEEDFIDLYERRRKRLIENAGINFPMKNYLFLLILSPIALGTFIYVLTDNAMFSVIVGSFGVLVPRGLIILLTYDNNKKFEERYAKSLRQLSASLESGSSILNAVNEVANCAFLHESMRKKYATLSSDLIMGIPVAEAFQRFANGTNSQDAEDVALAIDIQNEIGGHEADVIRDISNNIYARIMLRREVNSIFAETALMVWTFDLLPPIIIIGFSVLNQQFVNIYFSNPIYMALFAVFLFVPFIGSFLNHGTIRKIKKGA